MPAAATISDSLVQDSIVRAVKNVCTTMVKREITFVGKAATASSGDFKAKPHIFGSVGFVGQVDGIVYLCLPDSFANQASADVLGMSLAEVEMSGDETVRDVIGEITNMTVGGFKNALCDVGFPCKLTLPTIVRGEHLAVSALKGADRHIFQFDCSGSRFVVDIQIRREG